MTYGDSALAASKGKTVKVISGLAVGSEDVRFEFTDGTALRMYHEQDCCETVDIQQIDGEGSDLLGEPLAMAEIVSSERSEGEYGDSQTWTFVKFATIKGYVTVRWLGSSNGYYGETPAFDLIVEGAAQ